MIVGAESSVLEVTFKNADIIKSIAEESGLFKIKLVQKRDFKNKYGEKIIEYLLHLIPIYEVEINDYSECAKNIAINALTDCLSTIQQKNKASLEDAIERASTITTTKIFSHNKEFV